jgi:hypothetical protein
MNKLFFPFFLAALFVIGCNFDGPPQVKLRGLEDGHLADPTAPLVIDFHEPVKAGSIVLRVIRLQTDLEGNISPDAEVFFDSTKAPEEAGGAGAQTEDRRGYTISLMQTLPIGPQLALVIEPGLEDDAGNTWTARQVIKFGFEFSCGGGEGGASAMPTTFATAVHFLLVDVDEPIAAQLQLFADIRVDPATGTFIGQFTNADRDPNLDCGMQCGEGEVCRTLPAPSCVRPAEVAGSPDEYPDYIPNGDAGNAGYTFTVTGCVRDQEGGTWAFANAPVDVQVTSPPVIVKGIGLNASLALDEGVVRGDGTFTAQELFLGTTPSGAARGTVTMRDIPADEVKPGVPAPPDMPAE